MRNARIRRGLDTSASISGFSRCSCSTIEPIGSSTSGIQISSRHRPGSVPDLRPCPPDYRRVDALAALAAEPARAALFLDVDGVLAPIVERPEDARVPRRDARGARAARPAATALVACVTGRTSELAREIVGVDGLRYVGQHGLELEPAAAACAERIHAFARATGWPDWR